MKSKHHILFKYDKVGNDPITRFKVANFVKQKKRIASSAKQAASKAGECSLHMFHLGVDNLSFTLIAISLSGKQAIFAPLISKLRAAGGGNASNLLCNNASGTPGADNLKALMMELEMCEANIEVIFLPTF